MTGDTPFDAGDASAVKARALSAKQRREQADADWRWLLGDARGCRIVMELLRETGALRPCGVADALTLATHAGRQSVGLRIIAAVRAADASALSRVIPEE